jgi:DNA-binding NtrC family response regulator
MFPDMVDLTPFREVLVSEDVRTTFFGELDVAARWQEWQPHLRALDELLDAESVRQHVAELAKLLIARQPQRAIALLAVCRNDPRLSRVSDVVARNLASELHSIPATVRAQAEEIILVWAVQCEQDTWDIDPETGEIDFLNLRRRLDDFSLDVIPHVLWKLVGVVHARINDCEDDAGLLLEKFAWCVQQAQELSPNGLKTPAALRLIAAAQVPQTVREGAKVLKSAVKDLPALDDGILDQYGLPLWPQLAVSRDNEGVRIFNTGIGAAIGVVARPAGVTSGDGTESAPTDVLSQESAHFSIGDNVTAVDVEFMKFGRRNTVRLEVAGEMPANVTANDSASKTALAPISRKRREAQHKYRESIDSDGIVVGSSAAMFEVFEHIHCANEIEGCPAVLILGEQGVGKTHIAQLLHDSSSRSSGPFKAVNAGGGGGDINIQRGEWIGYGQGHGIQGIDKQGRSGHLMAVNGGTLFVDEFATLSHDLQVIFLSVLERRTIEKIGGESLTPDVRCIFATNADIDNAVANGTLRRDLVDRIGITISIPALRERRGDILMLAKHFGSGHGFTERCLIALLTYDWPGNVRELQKQIVRAVARKKSEDAATIDLPHLDLPQDIITAAGALDDDACRSKLWCLADEVARDEGFAPGNGLQKRAGEIMGVGEAQASKMYRSHVTANTASV